MVVTRLVQYGGLEEGVAIKGDVEEEPAARRAHELAPVRPHAQRLRIAVVGVEWLAHSNALQQLLFSLSAEPPGSARRAWRVHGCSAWV